MSKLTHNTETNLCRPSSLSAPPHRPTLRFPPTWLVLFFSPLCCCPAFLGVSFAQMEFELYSQYDADDADYSAFLTYAPSDVDYYNAADDFQLYAELPTLTRPALFKQRPAKLERVAIPTMRSTERFTQAPAITQETLTERRPEMLQTVKAHPSYEMRPAETKQAAIPVMLIQRESGASRTYHAEDSD